MTSRSLISALRAISTGGDLSAVQYRETRFLIPAVWTYKDDHYSLTLYGQRLLDAADLSATLRNPATPGSQ